ncbi:MAG TPA: hypothetical protein VFI95_04220, partial [Terriglobales bacterium]|nr:hypothetical protein [Terriglobales bacterium]
MRRFHLPRDLVVTLLRRFPYQLPVEVELVPVVLAAFVDGHRTLLQPEELKIVMRLQILSIATRKLPISG